LEVGKEDRPSALYPIPNVMRRWFPPTNVGSLAHLRTAYSMRRIRLDGRERQRLEWIIGFAMNFVSFRASVVNLGILLKYKDLRLCTVLLIHRFSQHYYHRYSPARPTRLSIFRSRKFDAGFEASLAYRQTRTGFHAESRMFTDPGVDRMKPDTRATSPPYPAHRAAWARPASGSPPGSPAARLSSPRPRRARRRTRSQAAATPRRRRRRGTP
jgi:hypothetical protein